MSDETVLDRYHRVEERIHAACVRAGRGAAEIELVAVSKTFGPEAVRGVADCGVLVFGENKVQEARAKIPACPGHLSWHMIGHLQTNKVRHAVGLFDVIHSVDSIRLLQAIDDTCERAGVTMRVYLEVSVSGEGSKHGLAPGELLPVLEATASCPRVEVEGLMAMPPFTEHAEDARPFFAQLRELRDRCGDEWGFPLHGLSMGMTRDFDIAIEEGATSVRVGTALFGRRTTMRKTRA